MKLVIIIGSGAVGKMTVGQALTRITPLRLFHNHMTIEPVIEIFGHYQGHVTAQLRQVIFEAFAKSDLEGMIFTYMCAFDVPDDIAYLQSVAGIFESEGATIYCVELVADQATRLQRNATENRKHHKASKRDTDLSSSRMLDEEGQYRLVSYSGEIPFEHYLRIENTHLSPEEVASMIKESFNL